MATGTNNIAKIWDFYTDINNNGDLENAKTSLSKKYGTFTNSAAPASGWGTGLCPSKIEWTNLNSYMKKGDIVVNGTYADNRLVKFTDLLYVPRSAELSINSTAWTSPVAGGSLNVLVSYTNADSYTVTSNQAWCTPPSGNQTASSVTISTSANTTTSYREATVTFSCKGRDGITVSKTLTVKQYGKTAISVNPSSLSFTPAGGKKTSTASPANLSTYSVTSMDTWCTVSKSNNTISVSATVNSGEARNTTVYVHGTGDYDRKTATASIAISQSSGISSISLSSNANYTPDAQSNKTATVTRTNISTYGVTRGNANWITVSKNGDTVTYSLETNGGTARTGTITVYGTGDYDNTKRTSYIRVGQESGVSSITISPNADYSPDYFSNKTATVKRVNVDSYGVTRGNYDWLTVSKSGDIVNYSITANSGAARTGTITVYGTGKYTGSQVSDSIYVSQSNGTPVISTNQSSLSYTKDGGSQNVTVYLTNITPSNYTVSSDQTWCTVSKSGTTLTITCDKTNSASTRYATVTLNGTGTYGSSDSYTISISQDGGAPSLSVSPKSWDMTSNAAASKSFTVTTSNVGAFRVGDLASWLTVSATSSTSFTLQATKNTGSDRSDTIYVSAIGSYTNTGVTASVTISQEGSSNLSVSPITHNMSPAAASGSSTVTAYNMTDWYISATSNGGWLSISKLNRNVNFSVSKNTGNERKGTIFVYGTGDSDGISSTATITVNQESGVSNITISRDANYTPAAQSGTATVTRTNISTYGVTRGSNSWITVSKSDNTVTYSMTTNTGAARTGTITVYGTGDYTGESLSDSIYVSQESGQSTISISSDANYSPAAQSNKTATVTRTNISTYGVTRGTADWLTVSKSGDTVNYSMTVNSGDARTGTITVYGTGDYDKTKRTSSIYVSQLSGRSSLSIDDWIWNVTPAGGSITKEVSVTNIDSIFVDSNDSPSWASASINGNSVTLYAAENSSSNLSRMAQIYIAGTGTYDGIQRRDFFSIRQAAGTASLTISPDANYSPAAQTGTATVTRTNISTYGVTRGNYDWLTVSKSGDTVNYSMTVNSGDARTGEITVYGTVGNIEITNFISVSQSSGVSSISITPTSVTAPIAGTSYKIPVTLTNASTYTISESYDWITTSISGPTATITVAQNTSTSARTGYVYFYTTGTYDNTERSASFDIWQPYDVNQKVTMCITNLQELVGEYTGDGSGVDAWIYVVDSVNKDSNVLGAYGLLCDLYYFDGSLYNEIQGARSDWITFCEDNVGRDLELGYTWDEVISGTYSDWGTIKELALENTWFKLTWPDKGGSSTPTVSISPSSLTFDYKGGMQTCTASGGTISAVSNSLSWVTTSNVTTQTTQIGIKATVNASSSSRSGYVYVTVGGQTLSIYVFQDGAPTKSCTFKVVETGWMDDKDHGFDLDLTILVGSKYVCADQTFVNGYRHSGEGDRTTELGTVNVLDGELFKLFANVVDFSGGTWRVVVDSSNEILASGNMDNLDSTTTSPALNIELYQKITNGDIVILYLEAGSSGGSSTGVVRVSTGGWASVTTPISGYNAYQSSTNYNVHQSVDTCRVYTSGKRGTFTIYINNHSEARYDYTVAGKLDTALPTSYSSVTDSVGQGSSKGTTAGLATTLSGWTSVSYDIPDTAQHWIDVAYRKDVNGNSGNDRGYLLVPSSW